MAAPYRHVDAPRLMGSWPIVGSIGSAMPYILPRTVLGSARILGTERQPVAGFAVGGGSFKLYVDATLHTISFSAGNKTLAQVVSEINAITAPNDVAFEDNGFLRLESPTSGWGSTLYVETDLSQTVLFELGLLSGLESKGGDLSPAPTIDYTRQVATHGQLSWVEGEEIDTRVFNRSLFQLAVNNDLVEGVVGKKRITVNQELDVPSYPAPSGPEGIEIPDFVYTGDGASPTLEELEKWFVVLDEDGKELVKEKQVVLNSATADFTTDPDTGDCWVDSTTNIFQATDPQDDMYVVPQGLVAPADVLNDKPLKIIRYLDAQNVVVWPVDPATGNLIVVGSQSGKTIERVRIDTLRCRVSGVYDGPGAGALPVMADARVKQAAVAVDRIDLGNRVYCSAADFSTVEVGDLVIWVGHAVSIPYKNDGVYRVATVIDDQTLELVGEHWGAAILNPDIFTGSAGTVEVSTDGAFWENPFLRFDVNGAIPDVGDHIRVLYYGMSTFREATDDPSFFVGPGLRYGQETDYLTQKAILAIIGPSATTIEDYVRDDRRVNLEDLDLRMDNEHYDYNGRHKDIRPDHINMFPGVSGTTLTIRNDDAEPAETLKAVLRDSADGENLWALSVNGYLGFHLEGSGGTPGVTWPRRAIEMGLGDYIVVSGTNPSGVDANEDYDTYANPLPNGTYYYIILAYGFDGGVSARSPEAYGTVDGYIFNIINLTWNLVPEASHYRIYRGTASGVYTEYRSTFGNYGIARDDGDSTYTAGSPPSPSATPSLYSAVWGGGNADDHASLPGRLGIGAPIPYSSSLSLGGALSIGLRTGDESLYFYSRLEDPTVYNPTWVRGMMGGSGEHVIGMTYGRFDVQDEGTPTKVLYGGEEWHDTYYRIHDEVYNTVFAVNLGGAVFIGNESAPVFSGTVFIRRPSGDQVTLWNSSSSEYWKIGSRTLGNFYVDIGTTPADVGGQKYPMVFDTDTGRVGIGVYDRDYTPMGALHVVSTGDMGTLSDPKAVVFEHRGYTGGLAGGPVVLLEYNETTSAVDDTDIIGGFLFRGSYTANTYAADGNCAIFATQVGAASASNSGGKLSFWTTPQNTTTRRTVFTLADSGNGTFDYDLYVTGGVFTDRVQDHYIGNGYFELGYYGTGDRSCYLDFHAQNSTDFDARVARTSGANGVLEFIQTGSGLIAFYRNASVKLSVSDAGISSPAGFWTADTTNPGSGYNLAQANLNNAVLARGYVTAAGALLGGYNVTSASYLGNGVYQAVLTNAVDYANARSGVLASYMEDLGSDVQVWGIMSNITNSTTVRVRLTFGVSGSTTVTSHQRAWNFAVVGRPYFA